MSFNWHYIHFSKVFESIMERVTVQKRVSNHWINQWVIFVCGKNFNKCHFTCLVRETVCDLHKFVGLLTRFYFGGNYSHLNHICFSIFVQGHFDELFRLCACACVQVAGLIRLTTLLSLSLTVFCGATF